MLPFIAAVFPVIVLFCGLTIDVGILELQKLQMQTAADSGAIAAELELERGTGNWAQQAKLDAAVNGYTDGSNNTVISVAQQPTQGPYIGRNDAVQVTITHTVQTLFMGTLNSGLVTLTARAAALMPACNYFLGSATAAYSFALSSSNSTSDCPVYVNSGMSVDSASAISGMAYNMVGPSSASNIAGTVSPNPYFNSPALADPLSSIASPGFTTCSHPAPVLSDPYNALNTATYQANSSGLVAQGSWAVLAHLPNPFNALPVLTLSPGTYCQGITLSLMEVVLQPGLYIITGGVNWDLSVVVGYGVTLFFTDGGGAGFGQIQIGSAVDGHQTDILLSAPNDSSGGGIPAVLFFFDRNWVPTSTYDLQCNDAFFAGDGIWYSIATGFSFNNCSVYGPNYFSMVTSAVSFSSEVAGDAYSFDLVSNYSNVSGGNPFRTQSVLVQ